MTTDPYVAYLRENRGKGVISPDGRAVLAAAVSMPKDWVYRFSGEDAMIEAVQDLSDGDLAAARLMVRYLDDALSHVETVRAIERLKRQRALAGALLAPDAVGV